ncbi:MAG: BrnA antitoxin family protein [Chloroflexota bacterium]|nr:BrnA antitoxin family protein [Chloroflexota bacterium]
MQKSENIVRYTAEELRRKRERGESQTDWARVDAMTEEDLEAAIASDPDEAGWVYDWDNVIIGIPGPKRQVTVRLDGDIIEWFKDTGKGYQTRMNAVLRSYVEAEKRKDLARRKRERASGPLTGE